MGTPLLILGNPLVSFPRFVEGIVSGHAEFLEVETVTSFVDGGLVSKTIDSAFGCSEEGSHRVGLLRMYGG